MTKHSALKRKIRARMAETGESYGEARRQILALPGGNRHRLAPQPAEVRERLLGGTWTGGSTWIDPEDKP